MKITITLEGSFNKDDPKPLDVEIETKPEPFELTEEGFVILRLSLDECLFRIKEFVV